jgi:hypothetical protein
MVSMSLDFHGMDMSGDVGYLQNSRENPVKVLECVRDIEIRLTSFHP